MNVRRELPAADWSLSWLIKIVLLSFATLETFIEKSKPDMNCRAVFCPDRRMEPLFIHEPRPKTAFNQSQKKRNSGNLK